MNKTRALAVLLWTLGVLPSAASEPDDLLPGKVAAIKSGSLVKFVSKAAPSSLFDMPDPSNDPVTQGGTLHLFDTVVRPGGDVTFTLPAGATKWKALGTPPGAKGYKYKGAGIPGDPCKVVLIKPKVVKAVCKGIDVALTLPFQGDLAVALTVGTDPKRYCAEFGGTPKGNPATIFKRKDAPPPGMCPSNTVPTDTPTATIFTTTPTATSTETATQTPTATATETRTETPTPVPCGAAAAPECNGVCGLGDSCLFNGLDCECFGANTPTPTSTPTETATATATPVPCSQPADCPGGCPMGFSCGDTGDGVCGCL